MQQTVLTGSNRRAAKRYTATASLSTENAFKSVEWRSVRSKASSGIKVYRITGDVPQGPILDSLLWKIMYDDVLRLQLGRSMVPEVSAQIGLGSCAAMEEDAQYALFRCIRFEQGRPKSEAYNVISDMTKRRQCFRNKDAVGTATGKGSEIKAASLCKVMPKPAPSRRVVN